MSYHELYGDYPDIDTSPWNEFTELAYWHDALIHDVKRYENISDEEFHHIEVKAAYTQCIMMKQIAENLAKMKEKADKDERVYEIRDTIVNPTFSIIKD